MLVIEINAIDAKALKRGIAGSAHIFRATVNANKRTIRITFVAKLGSEYYFAPAILDRTTDQLLIGEWAVHISGIKEVDAEIECVVERGDGLGFVAIAVEVVHAHAT